MALGVKIDRTPILLSPVNNKASMRTEMGEIVGRRAGQANRIIYARVEEGKASKSRRWPRNNTRQRSQRQCTPRKIVNSEVHLKA